VTTVRVYVSVCINDDNVKTTRELIHHVELANESNTGARLELVVVDTGGHAWRHHTAALAERASSDKHAVAYLGDYYSAQVAISAPILAGAGLLQVAPLANEHLPAGETLVQLVPANAAGGATLARWLTTHAVTDLLIVHDYGTGTAEHDAAEWAAITAEAGVRTRMRRVWDHDERPQDDIADARAVCYVGVAGSGAFDLWNGLHTMDPALWLLGTEGVAQPWLAAGLSDGAAERTRFFTSRRAGVGAYGFEAMTLIIDAVTRAGADRAAVAAVARTARQRVGAFGRYTLDGAGRADASFGVMCVVAGELVWETPALSRDATDQ
jgi:ABC-type branched-subunit amino acid transport system substrate-binding protein